MGGLSKPVMAKREGARAAGPPPRFSLAGETPALQGKLPVDRVVNHALKQWDDGLNDGYAKMVIYQWRAQYPRVSDKVLRRSPLRRGLIGAHWQIRAKSEG